MKKKYLIVFFTTIICLFLFNITAYASTDYSVYDEETGKYSVRFSDSMKTSLGLPTEDLPFDFDTENLYYFLVKEDEENFYFFYNTRKFLETASDKDGFSGTYTFRDSSYNLIMYYSYNVYTGTWVKASKGKQGYSTSNLSSILVSSDDIVNNATGETIVSKTTYKEPSAYRGENFILSASYNRDWIKGYLDLNQDPVVRN